MDKVDNVRIETLKKLANVFNFNLDAICSKMSKFYGRNGVASKKLSDIAFFVYEECWILWINYVQSFAFNQFNLQ